MRTNIILCALAICLLAVACNNNIVITNKVDTPIRIFPDYDKVTVPVNIAPLNFSVMEDASDYSLIIQGKGTETTIHAKDGTFDIPIRAWKNILQANKDNDIILTVAKRGDNGWIAYRDITIHVSGEEIDPYLTYRLIPPYEQWNRMGIYQRDLESFEESPIFDNKLTDYGCVNCHTFNNRQPDKMIFHSRAKAAGTALIDHGQVKKLNTKTPATIGNMQYPFWHPTGKYIVASVNATWQSYYYHSQDRVEVYDTVSDVLVYDMESLEVFTNEQLSSDHSWETFPTFSPDGKSLYFCTAEAIDSVEHHIEQLKYSLCRVDFDADSKKIGTKVDTLFNAKTTGMSVSHPRISPNGRWMVVCLTEYGNFPVNHKDADLYIIDLQSGDTQPLEGANSERADSYHTWGSNSHWMVFSSRRVDGYYSRPYITYIDDQGKASKPFMLPQRHPYKYYIDQMMSYNLPELVSAKVEVNQRKIALTLKNSQGENMK
jgi:Tol biopolymer transport system component